MQDIQRKGDLRTDGVVDGDTRGVLKRTMPKGVATWYGPGFYGNRTACGQKLRPTRSGSRTGRSPAAPRSRSPTAASSCARA